MRCGIPKYANLKFTNNSPVSQVTTKKAQIIRIKDEIKFLFKKKRETQSWPLYFPYDSRTRMGRFM